MSAGEESSDAPDPWRSGASVLREEARHVLDSQLRTLRETDRKSMATARVAALILGLLLSAGSLADAPGAATNSWIAVGASLVLASLAIAVLTYSVDRPSYGISPEYLDAARKSEHDHDAVKANLLAGYADWIRDNGDEISSNGTYLLASQGLLVLGLAGIAVGMYQLV